MSRTFREQTLIAIEPYDRYKIIFPELKSPLQMNPEHPGKTFPIVVERWRSREEILKEHLDSLSPDEFRRVRPSHYWLRYGLPAWQRKHARKYAPNQPRVPAGNSDGGRWTSGLGVAASQRLAYVIRVCIISGVSRTTDAFGNKTWRATYDCAGGRSFIRQGPWP